MPFAVLEQSQESFLVTINGINLEATVTNRSDVAATWIDQLDLHNRRNLIVGIRTNGIYTTRHSSSNNFRQRGPIPEPSFFANRTPSDNPTSSSTTVSAATSFIPPVGECSSSKSPVTSKSEIELVRRTSFFHSPPKQTLSELLYKEVLSESKAPIDPSVASSSAGPPLSLPLNGTVDPSTSLTTGGSSAGNAATLQLCCGQKCLIFSLRYQYIPEAIVSFLFDRNQVTLVGNGVRHAGDWLGRPNSMLVYRDPWELGEMRAWQGLRRLTTIDQLAGRLLGREKVMNLPPVQTWDGWPLTKDQMAVACLEVYLLSQIGEKLVDITRDSFACYFMYTL